MDRVQPLTTERPAEAFMPIQSKHKIEHKEVALRVEDLDYPIEQDSGIIILTRHDEEKCLKKSKPKLELPRIVITKENETIDFSFSADFANLSDETTFAMAFTGRTTCKIMNSFGLILFRGKYPKSKFFEGWSKRVTEKFVDIVEYQNSELMLQLKYTIPACQACFEEETTKIDINDGHGKLLATIVQKKIWMNANIAREVRIMSADSNSKSDSFRAEFSWNDLSVNFKSIKKNGLVVANLIKETKDSKSDADFTLEIMKDIQPADKAVLVAFMLARDLLMIDEKQTRSMVERVTAFIVLTFVVVIALYFVLI